MLYRTSRIAAGFALSMSVSFGQQSSAASDTGLPHAESNRILGIVPNYRTSPNLQNYKPLTTAEKFKVASEDAFDPGTVALAAMFGGQSLLNQRESLVRPRESRVR